MSAPVDARVAVAAQLVKLCDCTCSETPNFSDVWGGIEPCPRCAAYAVLTCDPTPVAFVPPF